MSANWFRKAEEVIAQRAFGGKVGQEGRLFAWQNPREFGDQRLDMHWGTSMRNRAANKADGKTAVCDPWWCFYF